MTKQPSSYDDSSGQAGATQLAELTEAMLSEGVARLHELRDKPDRSSVAGQVYLAMEYERLAAHGQLVGLP